MRVSSDGGRQSTAPQRNALIAALDAGTSTAEVRRTFGIPRSALTDTLKRAGR
jgi:hypothetical protein